MRNVSLSITRKHSTMAAACASNDEFWKECASWLTRWGMLKTDHRANLPSAAIGDLAHTLRDGVLLCTLLSKIDPHCIDMKLVNLKPALARFLCLRNILLFLNICRHGFGLKESDLFEEGMLFDFNNFYKVLCTLSKLSLTPKAVKSIQGFCAQTEKNRDDIYQSLKTIEPPSYNTYYDDGMEDTYQTIIQVTENRELRLQVDEPSEKRDYVIKELVDTEKNYVDVLCKLHRNFMLKLNYFISKDHLDIIFYHVPELYEIHKEFLNQLSNKSTKLSSIFISHKDKFLVYGGYCSNLSNACTTLQDICDRQPEVFNKIEELEKQDNNGKFKLRDVLSVPMQRVLKYHLLLERLIELTDTKHEEYKDLKRARECMLDVAEYINEYARDTEQLTVIKQVRENITNWDNTKSLEHYGKLIKDGEIKIKPHDDGKLRIRYVFIFQKCMILCKSLKDNKFMYRDMLNFHDITVDEGNSRPVLSQNARWSYQWILVKNVQQTGYTCSVRTPELKAQMIKALRDCINNIKLSSIKTSHKYEMFTFEKPMTCTHCSKYLKGLIYQGYKCKECGIGVHKECISNSGHCGIPPPLPPLHTADEHLKDKLWFVGEMDRHISSAKLQLRANGTYLVRVRPQSENKERYALSLKTDGTIKHMKIFSNMDGSTQKFYLSTAKYFNSIEKLVENYQMYSLKDSFEGLNEHTKLEYPFKQMRAIASRDFEAQDVQQLPLRNGQEVIVLCQEGYRKGWWKGSNHVNGRAKTGFFPSEFVNVKEVLHTH
ncbi:hypothetical protein Trydic_g1266 [Trypoxylus dichotomus]